MNNEIFFFFYNLSNKSEFFDQFIIFTAHAFPYIVIVLAFLYLLFHHEVFSAQNPIKEFIQKWKEVTFVFFSGILAWSLASILKFLFHTERPFVVFKEITPLLNKTDFSFPSGHATFFMALAVALFFSHKKIGIVFLVFALLIGMARIVAGVHFPIDILGGFILGFTIAFFLRNV